MNRRQAIARLAATGAAGSGAASAAWTNAFAEQLKKDLLAHWENERQYSLAVVGAMPEERCFARASRRVFNSAIVAMPHASYARAM